MMPRTFRFLCALGGLYFLCALCIDPTRAQLTPIPQERGGNGLGLALRRLGVTGRVLYVTAHPDDENNGVLVALSRGRGLRTGLMTLTRGDGGQNAIGPELFEALGVLRTEELNTLHRYDGVEQYFSLAYEFGYSFSVEETFQKWGHDATLGDVVQRIRTFQPDVILTLPLESKGGGQHHQAAARLAVEAFRAAADPARFPEQLGAGLAPWQARKVYQGGVGGGREPITGPPPVSVPTGVYDALLGMSWQELGSIARTLHRCQGASQLKADPGPAEGLYYLVDSAPAVTRNESDVLDGVDVSLPALRRFVSGQEARVPFLEGDLALLQKRIDDAQAAFDAQVPEKTLPALRIVLDALRAVRARIAPSGLEPTALHALLDRLADEEADAQLALALAQGLAFVARVDDGDVVPGQAFGVTARVFNQGPLPLAVNGLSLQLADGWTARTVSGEPKELGAGQGLDMKFAVTVAENARPSQPYWHRREGADRYDVDDPRLAGLPWAPPDVMAVLDWRTGGTAAQSRAPAVWRYEGPWVGGEKQKVVNVVPALSVRVVPGIAVAPLSAPGARKEFRLTVLNGAKGPSSATMRLEVPAGWKAEPAETPVAFRVEGEEIATRFFVTVPSRLEAGNYEVRAIATAGGREYREGYQVIAYHHIQERHLFHPAASRVEAFDVRVAPEVSVGYVMGSGDEVPEALRQIGVPVTALGPDDVLFGDLSRYTTIVIGIRAYQVRPELRSSQQRLMDYVRGGGHLIVQYHRADFNFLSAPPRRSASASGDEPPPDSPFTPYPASIAVVRIVDDSVRTADGKPRMLEETARITDENAPVRILSPDHPIFTTPNRIGPADWQGWVQERGTYFLDARDPRYVELVAMSDPFPLNAGERKGALVEAPVGKGTWTYVGLGLFRQLAAGTPGAYRLLANLVSRPRGQ
jgi:LmbE family N-acetylglucosaminyl deacetylase